MVAAPENILVTPRDMEKCDTCAPDSIWICNRKISLSGNNNFKWNGICIGLGMKYVCGDNICGTIYDYRGGKRYGDTSNIIRGKSNLPRGCIFI